MNSRVFSRRRFVASATAAAALATLVPFAGTVPDALASDPVVAKGFQLVLLSYWTPTDVTSLLGILKDNRAPSAIQFGFVPFQIKNFPNPPTNFQNARTLLRGMLAAGKSPSVAAHLSLHASGTGSDTTIANNAANLAANFLPEFGGKIKVAVSPSLEDNGSDADFVRWGKLIAKALGNRASQVYLRRSATSSRGISNPNNAFAGVEAEIHGAVTNAGSAYSNDGNFVYYPQGNETAESLPGGASPTYKLADFLTSTQGLGATVLIWRPAYNLDVKTYVAQKRIYTYSETGRDLLHPGNKFDATEAEVARQFLWT